jgi:GT2 family glycosyltransferase
MILNPDVLTAPNLFIELLAALGAPDVGLVEARQLPVEHPKHYDPETGETSWASGACAMAPRQVFQEVNGFDSDTFFLYCDDVDLSWRVRLAGLKVVHRCSAVVFHDKRISESGGWLPSAAERYYSAEASLLLPYKYSRPDLTESNLDYLWRTGDEVLQRAASAFESRKKTGRLPTPIDPNHQVAQFIDGAYSVHRFQAR